MCLEAISVFDSHLSAVCAGRRWVADQLSCWGAGGATFSDDLLLATSELLGNAVKFGSGAPVTVALAAHAGSVRVAVTDDHPGWAVVADLDEAVALYELRESGRGMGIVAALSSEWGQDRGDGGKTVWCRFALPPGSRVRGSC
jgi:anti-sigma regulatory factor (Ser/Thr protein kinase)